MTARLVFRTALVLAAALGSGAGCAWWDETAPPPGQLGAGLRDRPNDDDTSALIPAGMETVIDVNMALVRQSPWVTPALEAGDPRSRANKARALGYDDVNDVDRLIYAVTTAGADAPTLVIAQGRMQQAQVDEAFRVRWPRAVVDRWRGISILASGENAVAFLTPRTFTAGSPAAVHAVIDRAFGLGDDVSADRVLGPTRRALCPEGRNAHPALLATVAVDQSVRARVGDAAQLPPELRQIGVRIDLGQSADVLVLGILDNYQAATALARRLRALIDDPATRLALGVAGLGTLPAQTHVVVDGARVVVRASVGDESRPTVSAWLRALVESTRERTTLRGPGSW